MAKTKTVKATKKTVSKKRSSSPEVNVNPTETKQESFPVSDAQKQFISDNLMTMAIEEIARATNLTVEQVEKVATSHEMDEKILQEPSVKKIRRFATYKGATMMTPTQSGLDDKVFQKNLPNKDEVNKQFGKDFEIIKTNQNQTNQPADTN